MVEGVHQGPGLVGTSFSSSTFGVIVIPGPPAPRWINVPSINKPQPRFCWTTSQGLDLW